VLFGDLGLSSHAVLTAVTATPAAACGLGARKARLAPGYDADLLIVDGDPVGDLRALLRPRAVVRAGRVVWP
jgi:imidazolonepropionase-like amidohydrolase